MASSFYLGTLSDMGSPRESDTRGDLVATIGVTPEPKTDYEDETTRTVHSGTETRNPEPEKRSPKPETPETRSSKNETRSPKPETRNPKPETPGG